MVHSGRMEGGTNRAMMCKTCSSSLACLPQVQRELLLHGYRLLLGLPCSHSVHKPQSQSSQLQPTVSEEWPTTSENAVREHTPKMLLREMILAKL